MARPHKRARAPAAGTLALGALLALALAACGSSEPAGKTSISVDSNAPASKSSGIQVDTTPKFAKPSPREAVHSGFVNIAYRDITIHPDVIRVKVGTTVKWTNYDPVDHNVTSLSGPQKFASEDFGKGGSYELKLTKPGVIHYECTIHPASMNGTIEVVR